MSIVLSFFRRRSFFTLLNSHRFLRRFSVDVDPPPGNKPVSQESKTGNLQQALSLKEDMKEKMVRPNVETYNALFRRLKEKSQVEILYKLMDEMVEESCEPNHITMEIILERLSDSADESVKLKKFLKGYSVASPTNNTFISRMS